MKITKTILPVSKNRIEHITNKMINNMRQHGLRHLYTRNYSVFTESGEEMIYGDIIFESGDSYGF